jgi:hypothetical protein
LRESQPRRRIAGIPDIDYEFSDGQTRLGRACPVSTSSPPPVRCEPPPCRTDRLRLQRIYDDQLYASVALRRVRLAAEVDGRGLGVASQALWACGISSPANKLRPKSRYLLARRSASTDVPRKCSSAEQARSACSTFRERSLLAALLAISRAISHPPRDDLNASKCRRYSRALVQRSCT